MKRDMELIRRLLVKVEGETEPDLSGYTELQLIAHRVLLNESGLAVGWVSKTHDGHPELGGISGCELYRLTRVGHEFLDAISDDAAWAKAKSVVKASAVSATAEVLKETCQRLLTAGIEAALRAAKP